MLVPPGSPRVMEFKEDFTLCTAGGRLPTMTISPHFFHIFLCFIEVEWRGLL